VCVACSDVVWLEADQSVHSHSSAGVPEPNLLLFLTGSEVQVRCRVGVQIYKEGGGRGEGLILPTSLVARHRSRLEAVGVNAVGLRDDFGMLASRGRSVDEEVSNSQFPEVCLAGLNLEAQAGDCLSRSLLLP
jgi:hypothetical protein